MSDLDTPGQRDTGLMSLALVMRAFGKPISLQELEHRFSVVGRSLNPLELVRSAKELGLKAKAAKRPLNEAEALHPPFLARLHERGWVIVSHVASDHITIVDAHNRGPQRLTHVELESAWSGETLLLAQREQSEDSWRRDLSWLGASIIRYRKLLAEVLIVSLILQVLALMTPLLFQVIIDKVLLHRSVTTLDIIMISLLGIAVFEAVMGGLRAYTFSHTTSRMDVELGVRLFRHLISLPMSFFATRRVGDSVACLRELENIRNFLASSSITAILDIFCAAVFLVVMFHYSAILTWVVIATMPIYVAVSLGIRPILRRRIDEKINRAADSQAFLVETISGIETIKALAVEPRIHQRWEEQLAAYVTTSFRAGHIASWSGQIAQLTNRVGSALVLWVGAGLAMEGRLTIGELVAFNMLATRLAAPALRIAQIWRDFQQFRASLNRIGKVLAMPPEPAVGQTQGSLPAVRGRLKFERVTFRYGPNMVPIIDDLTLDVAAGQTLGIVGTSGSGKSTLAKLVQRLYVPDAGRVTIDGIDLANTDPTWVRRQIGVVLQENVLFNRSVRENIALANPSLSLDRIIAAAELAGAHEFITGLPNGYDTIVGERGATLSGGQRQRIAIARALVFAPPILIFDEATSALDYETERLIQDRLVDLAKGRTVIVIAHRLAALRSAHRIVTMERGRIIEDGTHEELLRRGGRYAALYRHQSNMSGAIAVQRT